MKNRIIKVGNVVGCGNSQGGSVYMPDGISPTLLSGMSHGNVVPYVITLGNIHPSGKGMNGNVIDSDGICSTITTNKGEGTKILIRGDVNAQ